jgi:hypothetical protein
MAISERGSFKGQALIKVSFNRSEKRLVPVLLGWSGGVKYRHKEPAILRKATLEERLRPVQEQSL